MVHPVVDPEQDLAIKKLRKRFGDSVLSTHAFAGDVTAVVRKDDIEAICLFLRDDSELRYDFLTDLCAVDYPEREERFEVVYHLYSMDNNKRLRIKAPVVEGETIKTVSAIWKTANWHEREAYDLMGVVFEGHPDLRRILMPPDWEGHPLRKDYPVRD